ncbi:MAG: FHA domain-containing protein [Gemmatimonadetes bacterium]|nr:FHA domain-containing protein [Gemmatimonadota bacterium]
MRAQLAVLKGAGTGHFFDLARPRCVIGRDDAADITLSDAEASGLHARLERAAGGHRLVDLESRNGTFLDGQPVQTVPLRHGDRFVIGGHEFQYLVDDGEA